uniref:Uncharacterized protein n=1 Tax=uncultured bacterium contig00024 TaxID=1181513 RepID=A0A806JZC5_9BACT|nr:hypothetical protein [uncultured bacterium contig00024]
MNNLNDEDVLAYYPYEELQKKYCLTVEEKETDNSNYENDYDYWDTD